jgi:hypothetical protein
MTLDQKVHNSHTVECQHVLCYPFKCKDFYVFQQCWNKGLRKMQPLTNCNAVKKYFPIFLVSLMYEEDILSMRNKFESFQD